mgnify:FL=1
MHDAGSAFLATSRRYLTADYLPRIRLAIGELPPADLWWRPNPASNSAGNLLLHLAGNVRQWLVAGVGGRDDVRDREGEFAAEGGMGPAEALGVLEAAVADADDVLAALRASRLGERRMIQGYDVTLQDAIYHVVEHFGMHTGQVIYIAKLRAGRDLGFYATEGNLASPRWQDLERR